MKSTKQHEQEYRHIRKITLLSFIATLFFSWLAWMNLKSIDWNIIKIAFDCEKGSCNLVPRDLIVCYPLILEYLFISLAVISFVAIFKNGFNNLKGYKDNGLIMGLIESLIMDLIVGLIMGLIVSLIGGLIIGLNGEFEDD